MIALHEIVIPSPWHNRKWGEVQLAIIWFYGRYGSARLKFVPSSGRRNYRFFQWVRSSYHDDSDEGRWGAVAVDGPSLAYIRRQWAREGKPIPDVNVIVIE